MKIKFKPFIKPENQVSILGCHQWSVPRLFELSRNLPVMEIPLEHFCTWHKYESMSLRKLVGHIKAVLDADLNCPIILDEDGEIMDGRHRLMKALLEGRATIKAVRFPENPEPCRVTEEEK